MEDFLKNRPVLDPKSALVLAADSKPVLSSVRPPDAGTESNAHAAAVPSPFADLRSPAQTTVGQAPVRTPAKIGAGGPTPEAGATAQQLTGEHGTHVQTVVERGRVTKIIVTCTCGQVTEIACQY